MATKNFRSLSDLSRRSATVHGFEVYSIRARVLSQLFQRFPALRALIAGKGGNAIDDIIEQAPEALAAIVAAGLEKPEWELEASELDLDVQLDFIAAILQVTFPNGIAAALAKLQGESGDSLSTMDPATT
jgi:hypothetical protein